MSQSILIVDDEVDLKNVIKRGLEMSGFSVTTECDPIDALENFRAGAYSLVISDIRMPKMNGFELYERLAKIDPRTKICFLTAFDVDYFEMFRQRFPHVPVRCFIKKPVSIASLIGMVRQELNRPAGA